MNCPVCRENQLVMTERSGIEIDYCPNCRGVWLDRGELDKIIERSAATGAVAPSSVAPQAAPAVWAEAPPQQQRPPEPRGYEQRPPEPRGYDSRDRDRDHKEPRRDHDDDYRHGHKRKKRGGFLEDLFDFD
ncbi:MAG TPA: zf-TFIIB domain-containing protein [Abditibacteriaceae bacterium]|jgi:hypothetical protein